MFSIMAINDNKGVQISKKYFLSPSETIMRAISENMISPDYVLF